MELYRKSRLIRRELAAVQPMLETTNEQHPYDVQTALSYIHAHLFEEDLNVNTVLEACELRNHNISGRFRRHVGLSIRRYIEDRRIVAAMRLLSFDHVEIYLIAAAVGYAHHESFTRAFKRYVGCSPSAYKRHYRERAESVKRKRQRRGGGRAYTT